MIPASVLILRIGRVAVPLPWFLLWLFLLPFVFLGWLIGNIGLLLFPKSYHMRVLSQSWRLVQILISLQGTDIRVNTAQENIRIRFI